jgi:hypothetical protein
VLTRPGILLRAEGAALLAISVLLYRALDGNWLAFALLLLAPDVGMIGYLRGTRLGASTYNLFHTDVVPAAIAGLAFIFGATWWLAIALIWLAHIGMDRLLGFGLKYPTHFKDTHLARA